MKLAEINLALGVFSAAAVFGGPIAAGVAAAFVAGLLIRRR
jgi:uncharacterized protein (TIGR03382 family)